MKLEVRRVGFAHYRAEASAVVDGAIVLSRGPRRWTRSGAAADLPAVLLGVRSAR